MPRLPRRSVGPRVGTLRSIFANVAPPASDGASLNGLPFGACKLLNGIVDCDFAARRTSRRRRAWSIPAEPDTREVVEEAREAAELGRRDRRRAATAGPTAVTLLSPSLLSPPSCTTLLGLRSGIAEISLRTSALNGLFALTLVDQASIDEKGLSCV